MQRVLCNRSRPIAHPRSPSPSCNLWRHHGSPDGESPFRQVRQKGLTACSTLRFGVPRGSAGARYNEIATFCSVARSCFQVEDGAGSRDLVAELGFVETSGRRRWLREGSREFPLPRCAIFHHHKAVRLLECAESMSDRNRRATLDQIVKRHLDFAFGFVVHR